jgi:hypothetical protein
MGYPQPVVPLVKPYPCSRVGSETGTGTGKALDTRGYTRAIRYLLLVFGMPTAQSINEPHTV